MHPRRSVLRTMMTCTTENLTVDYGDKKISAAITFPSGGLSEVCIILTHGAGGDMNSKQLVLLAEAIADKGISVMRFTCKGLNLKYRTKVYARVVSFILASTYGIKQLFLAGRSLGSRAAVNVANEYSLDGATAIKGVVCLSYPLYPPQSPNNTRDAPLYDLKHSCLFISGDTDNMCSKDRMKSVLQRMHGTDMHWIKNAGHDLINKSIGLEETVNLVANIIINWCSKLCSTITITGTARAVLENRCKEKPCVEVKGRSGQASTIFRRDEPISIVRVTDGAKTSIGCNPTAGRKRKRVVCPPDTER